MVLLTITPSILEGLAVRDELGLADAAAGTDDEPTLQAPELGNPISHGQIVDLWKQLKVQGKEEFSLERLLKGSKVYVPPPKPKAEPSAGYKALMARLRREEEARAYERMLNPPAPLDTFSQRFPGAAASMSRAFAEANRPTHAADMGDDDVTFADVHRQLMLILNFIVSIAGVAGTLWVLARWWSTPARLLLAMGGGIVVGIAEVAVYSGYVWHLSEAKKKEKTFKEVKEVVQTWVVEAGTDDAKEKQPILVDPADRTLDDGMRRRRKDPI